MNKYKICARCTSSKLTQLTDEELPIPKGDDLQSKNSPKTFSLSCTKEFLGGVVLFAELVGGDVQMLDVYLDERSSEDLSDIKSFRKIETDELLKTVPQHLEDVEEPYITYDPNAFSLDKTKEERQAAVKDFEAKYNQALEAIHADAVSRSGYDMFLNFNDGGTTHVRFTNPDYLRGFQWALQSFNCSDRVYSDFWLYLNGARVVNLKTHLSTLDPATT